MIIWIRNAVEAVEFCQNYTFKVKMGPFVNIIPLTILMVNKYQFMRGGFSTNLHEFDFNFFVLDY